MPARLKDVAAACDVDVSTVSRALRGDERIRDDTIERIRAVAKQMGYRANSSAQALVGAKTRVVWLILSRMGNVLEQEIAEAASRCLEEKGYDLAVALSHGSDERYRYLLKRLLANPVDGALVVPPFTRYPSDAIGSLAEEGFPLVFVDRYPQSPRQPVVTTANRDSACELVRLLSEGGIDRLLFLDSPEANQVQAERCAGYISCAEELGIRYGDGHEDAKSFLDGRGRLGLVASMGWTIDRFVERHGKQLDGAEVCAGAFDGWPGDKSRYERAVVCTQDFGAIARSAVAVLMTLMEGNLPERLVTSVPPTGFTRVC